MQDSSTPEPHRLIVVDPAANTIASDACPSGLFPAALRRSKNLLIVTAHPDDETLFFAPSILGVLGNRETTGGLLVLSNGNNYGLGDVRKLELKGACQVLGVAEDRCESLNRPDLQDNPKKWWSEKAIISAVKEYVEKWHVDAIITFDDGGISGHINHRAVSSALQIYASSDTNAPVTYLLSSVALLRKYTFVFDLPLTSLPFTWRIIGALLAPADATEQDFGDKALIANTWLSYLKTRQAFRSHDSQYSWDRSLYLVLSRQVWFNNLVRVERKK
ncbi:hypothetical protein EG329_007017 [Mollisiaceae sp. DMI_Dod_QoI]|nr:hypothetical protein EG329_007017 [Helotiales sp. DMI_Dod_QoI]